MTAIVLRGDARQLPLPDECVDLLICSPPYFGLRSYTDGGEHYAGQIGSEATPQAYLEALWACTREWVRVLKPSGSLFVNLGDKYQATSFDHERRRKDASGVQRPSVAKTCERCGEPFTGGLGRRFCSSFCGGSDNSKRAGRGVIQNKSLLGIPWRYAIGCTDRLGLILRAEIVWAKPNGLPESVTDRVRRAHEQVFHFTRQPRYYAAVDEIREPQQSLGERHIGRSGNVGSPSDVRKLASGVRALDPLGKLPGSVWSIPSAPLQVPARLGVDHFAAFPPALVRPLVLGWSPPGICTGCGEGRRPVVDKTLIPDHAMPNQTEYRRNANVINGGKHWTVVGSTSATITGYACACTQPTAPARPSVILDPFGGTGTTALVASTHGRVGITVDRSADYCRLAAWRVNDPGERARARDMPKPPPIPDGQTALFGLEAL